MGFVHGRKTAVVWNGYNLTSYFNDAQVSRSVETAETTVFGDSAKTFIPGMMSGTIALKGMFDAAVDAVDTVMSSAIGADNPDLMTVAPEGLTVGKPASSAKVREASYEISSPATDVVGLSVEGTADGGVDRGVLLAAATAATGSGSTSSVDQSAGTTSGAIAYLHVTANTRDGASTIKVQHSSDNSVWADLITFTSVSASTTGSERAVVTGTVNRYVRASHAPGGSTGSVTYTVAFARK